MKIAVYTMAKNEAVHVDRFAQTTADADYRIITDTGSTDGTQDLLRERGITVRDAAIMPWRFDTATNVALANVPPDADCCIKLDLDETLSDGWRSEIERLWKDGVNRINYWYTWNWIAPGVPGIKMVTGNIHGRSGYIWRHAGHAALCTTVKCHAVMSHKLEIHHFMINKGRPDYINLLELAVEECPCPRTLYYLGREYYFKNRNDDSIKKFSEYLAHPKSLWKAQRAEAMRFLALCHERKENLDQTLEWLLRASTEKPNVRDIWYEILRYMSKIGDWKGGQWAASRCLKIQNRDPEFVSNTYDAWYDRPFEFAAVCALRAGDINEARGHLAKMKEINPAAKAIPFLEKELS